MSDDAIELDPHTLRGLAHPLRVRLLGLLRTDGPSTASRLAERLGQSSGATSYHLRQLAAHGLVTEEEGRGTTRERWWRAVHRGTVLKAAVARATMPETEGYLRAVAAEYAQRTEEFVSEAATLPPEWNEAWTLSDVPLRLTAAEAHGLREELFALMKRYRRDDDPAATPPAGAERVLFQVQLLPQPRGTDR